jgi:para-nitrobenzyl esterase
MALTSRRRFLQQSAITLSALRFPGLVAQQPAISPVVKTSLGTLGGLQADGVRIFRGVLFATPPVGALRFLPPLPARPWTGELDATAFSASPMQTGEPGVRHSEDCLYLNIWAPEGKGPFPVFVWIHGGGFSNGHAFESVYDGSQFAREGIVVVTVAYRLGVFGFLDLEPILGPDYAGSANNALRDVILALGWIQSHIADFGGDPTRVTIGGESAGAKLTDILMGIPSAHNLFHQMISESGGAERVWPARTAAAEVSQGFAAAYTKATSQPAASLKTADAASLIPLQRDFIEAWPKHFPLRAEVDGKLLPRLPIETIAAGSTKGKRLLIGTNRDESALFLGPRPEHDPTALDLGNLPLTAFDAVYARYKSIYPDMTDVQRRIRAVTAEEYWIPSMRVADAHTATGGTTFMYRLDFTEASGRLSGYAYHSLDVGLVWDKPHVAVENAAAETALAAQIHTAWAAFIRGEAPNSRRLPTWPEYNLSQRSTMILNTDSKVAILPQNAELRVWDNKL